MKSLRRRLWLGFGGMLLILALVSALSVIVFTRYSHALERVFRENYDSAVYCDAMKDALDRLDLSAQRRLWDAAAVDPHETSARIAQFDDNLARQLNNVSLPGEAQASQTLAREWDLYRAEYVSWMGSGRTPDADSYRQKLLPVHDRLKGVAQQIADMNMRNMVSVDGRAKRTLVSVRNALLVLVIAGTALAALLVGAVAATILRPLKALTHCADEISRGNFDLKVHARSSDEIGQLAGAFDTMAARLREFRRKDDERLARTRQATQVAIDSLAEPVLLIGPDRVVEIANRAAQSGFGFGAGAAIDGLHLEWLSRLYDSVRETGQPFNPPGYGSAIQVFEDGHERFLLPHAVPVVDAAGAVIGVTIILVDVTRLRHADELKSGLLSAVSHELRTPLTSARMALGLLTGGRVGSFSDTQSKLLNAARQDVERLYRIIENLLNASRIEAGMANVQPRPMAPRELIALAVDPLRQAAAERELRIDIDLPDDLPFAWADPANIGYALGNLVANAVEYTPAGGAVRVWARGEGQVLRFGVDDTGPGIPPEYAGRLFDKFFRLPRDGGRRGAGLGLSIAKQIVEAHGGKIEFSPGSAGGSSFQFTLPVAPSAATSVAHLPAVVSA